MTKERKAAIKQWEEARKHIRFYGIFSKPFTEYDWYCHCWFCQYVRDHSTPDFDNGFENGCAKCPLWKWARAHNGEYFTEESCGCSVYYNTLYQKVCDERLRLDKRIKACDLIIAALKGEHIWEKAEE